MKLSINSSFSLNLIRVLSAQAVLVGHSVRSFGLDIPFLMNNTDGKPSSMDNLSVVVFFVLSGTLTFFRFYFVRLAYDITLSILFAGTLLFLLSYCQNFNKVPNWLNKTVSFIANYSFTLISYSLYHYECYFNEFISL